jgi:methylaspartate ammonia-lyase
VATPLRLLLGSPVEMKTRAEQIGALAALRRKVLSRAMTSELIAEFWCASRDDHLAFAAAGAADYQMDRAPTIGDRDPCERDGDRPSGAGHESGASLGDAGRRPCL